MAFDSNPGTSRLANVLAGRMRKEGDAPLVLDFGEIQSNGSLITNTFQTPIPKGDYSVLRQLTLGEVNTGFTETSTEPEVNITVELKPVESKPVESESIESKPVESESGTITIPSHMHEVKLPSKMRNLAAGDRVLVAWVQNEAVVIDIVMRS